MGCCIVVGAGTFDTPIRKPRSGDLVIAADGGLTYLAQSGVAADVVVGDFDSLGSRPNHENVLELPKEKDDTDLLFALKYGLGRGYKEFHIYGGTGGRMDHTLANLQCLLYLAERGARGFLHGGGQTYTCVKNDSIEFDPGHAGTVSVFAWGGCAEGVALEGLSYPLSDARLTPDYPLGVSNFFTGQKSKIAVKNGALLVTYPIRFSN
ncbi:MAG: thiamine diphosphokinase [Clostridiaceae bacterium]|nr:thiamine diphosphokinase [Eubacteriales bacterium]